MVRRRTLLRNGLGQRAAVLLASAWSLC